MKNPNQLSHYELLSPENAEAYLLATYGVLSQVPYRIDGVVVFNKYGITTNPQGVVSFDLVDSINPDEGVSYDLSVSTTTDGVDKLSINQAVMSDGRLRTQSVQRLESHRSGKVAYRHTGDDFPAGNIINESEARDLFVTIGSDFRAALTDMLAERTDLLREIEQAAEAISSKVSKQTLYERAIGQLSLRDGRGN
jgi:hypothetical protein